VGGTRQIYCAVIYFPNTGECRVYDVRKLTPVE